MLLMCPYLLNGMHFDQTKLELRAMRLYAWNHFCQIFGHFSIKIMQ